MINVKKNEIGKVSLVSLIISILSFGFSIGWASIHTLLVKRIGIAYLPYTYILYSVFIIVSSSIYLFFADKLKRPQLLGYYALAAGVMIIFARLLITNRFEGEQALTLEISASFVIILIAQGLCGSTLPMLVWTMINDLFLPSQGVRLYPLFGIANLMGVIVAGFALQEAVFWIGMGNLILLWGVLLFVIVFLAAFCQKKYGGDLDLKIAPKDPKNPLKKYGENFQQTVSYIKNSSLCHLLALMTSLFYLLSCLMDFQYTKIMNSTFTTEEQLARYYGYYGMAISLTAIVLQFFASEKIIRYVGVFRSSVFQSIAGIVGFCALIFHFSFWEGLFFRYSWELIGAIIQMTLYQLSFMAFQSQWRGRIRAFIDGIVVSLSTILGGGLLLLITNFTNSSQMIINGLGIVLALSMFLLAFKGNSVYIRGLIDNLKQKKQNYVLEALESLEEPRVPLVYETLRSIVRNSSGLYDVVIRKKAIEVLSRLGNINAVKVLLPFFQSQNLELKLKAIESIRNIKNLKSYDFAFYEVQRELKKIFKEDKHFNLRLEAGRFLIQYCPKNKLPLLVEELFEAEDEISKILAIQTLDHLQLPFSDVIIHRALINPSPKVRAEAVLALWKTPEADLLCYQTLNALITSTSSLDQQQGLKTLLRLQAPIEFKRLAHNLMSDVNVYTRLLATIVYLSTLPPEVEEFQIVIKQILEILANPTLTDFERREIMEYLVKCKEEILDNFFIEVMKISPEKRSVLEKGLSHTINIFKKSLELDDLE